GRRDDVESTDIRRALKLYRVADLLLIALFGVVAALVILA
ncbi:MAG: cobalamin biosynthesis protein, partial [Mesorhizobium sp.]